MERSKWLTQELNRMKQKQGIKNFKEKKKKISLGTTDINGQNYPNILKPKKFKATRQI